METKICSICKIEKPANNDYFHKNTSSISGLRSECKDCTNKRHKEYQRKERIASITKETALSYAKLWNEARMSMGTKHFSVSEIIAMRISPYAVHYSSAICRSEYVKKTGFKDYSWAEMPIPFTFFIKNPPIYKATTHKASKFNPSENENDKITNNIGIESYTDIELASELRLRGFEVTAKKLIEL